VVYPTKQTTYITEGSGLDLCTTTAYTTIYIRSDVTGPEEEPGASGISLAPNPGSNALNVIIDNDYTGDLSVHINSSLGIEATSPMTFNKSERSVTVPVETSSLRSGIYVVVIRMGSNLVYKKWLKI
jgi:hypothetical protein